jgi:hypothetical protein
MAVVTDPANYRFGMMKSPPGPLMTLGSAAATGWPYGDEGSKPYSYLLQCNKTGCGMRQEIEWARELGIAERTLGGWRVVAAAWSIAIALVVLFATGQALASRHDPSPREGSLAGAVIPHHDPSFPGPDEMAASDWLERVRAEAYSGL